MIRNPLVSRQVEDLDQGSQDQDTKTEFAETKLKVFRKKNLEHFWSKFAPPEFRLIKYRKNGFS